MDSTRLSWWSICTLVNQEYLYVYVRAYNVTQITDYSVIVDDVDMVFDNEIVEITKEELFSFKIILHVLDHYLRFEKNDSVAWNRLEELIPGVACNGNLNTPDVIARTCLRFQMNGEIYEYNGENIIRVMNLVRKTDNVFAEI